MGCDIHAFIEYKQEFNGKEHWSNFGGEFNLGRHYGMFAKMAGVRDYGDDLLMFDPRGLPAKLGGKTSSAYYLYVTDRETDDLGYCSRESAERWVKSGCSHWNDRKTHVSDPDAHSMSWLNIEEFESTLQDPEFKYTEKYSAALAAMKSLAESFLGARLVFWFDN